MTGNRISMVVTLDCTEFHSVDYVEAFLRQALTDAGLQEDGFELAAPSFHPDWDPTEGCPNCGSRQISEMAASEDVVEVDEQGSRHFIKSGDAHGITISEVCRGCGTTLCEVPYTALKTPGGDFEPKEIPSPQWGDEAESKTGAD